MSECVLAGKFKKTKHRSLVVRKIIRAVEIDKEPCRISVLGAMVMLRKSWDDVSEQTIVNCFRKDGISEKSQEHAADEDDDPSRSLCTAVDDSIADLEFNLDQLRQINPELAPDELDAAGLIDIDACIATNQSQALTVEEIVSDFTEECDVPLMEVDSDSDSFFMQNQLKKEFHFH